MMQIKPHCAIWVIVALTAWLWAPGAMAQKHQYPVYEDNDQMITLKVKSQGARPTIVDFASTYLDYAKDTEIYFLVNREWQKYLKKQPLSKDIKVMADVKNGYMCFEWNSIEANEKTVVEMCFWNCADGLQKLFCVNNYVVGCGDYLWTEYTGAQFYVYDNAKKEMRLIYPEDIGALYDGDGLSVFFLPRKGKNIKVSAAGAGERWDEELIWNGFDFQ